MGRMWRFNAIKLPDGGLCNKEPWIGVLCNKSWHPTTGQWGSRSFLETGVFSLQISESPHCLCTTSFAMCCCVCDLQFKDNEV